MKTSHDFERLLAIIERLPAAHLPAGRIQSAVGHSTMATGGLSFPSTQRITWLGGTCRSLVAC